MPFHTAANFSFMFDPTLGVGTRAAYSEGGFVNLILSSSNFDDEGFSVRLKAATVTAKVLTSAIPNIDVGQNFVVDGAHIYEVKGIGPDEEGVTELDLKFNRLDARVVSDEGVRVDSSGRVRVRRG